MSSKIVALVLSALLLAGCAGQGTTGNNGEQTGTPQIALEQCQLSMVGMPEAVEARCGTLSVPEDRSAEGGRTIDLNIAVVPAVGRSPQADPLVMLAGGPGQAATEAYAPLIDALQAINQERDLVLVDQRGTGGSNPLACTTSDTSWEADVDDAAYNAWLQECLQQLEANPALYTTAIAAADLDAVRAALGYEQWNLLGVSYGTRMALTYLQLYPERVRSLVLDGVVPQDIALGVDFARDAQRAVDAMFARCEADAACNAAFPDVRATFASLLEQLEREAASLTLDDPTTGKPVELELTRDMVAITVQSLSYAPETVALLPLLIHQAGVEGDLRPLAAQMLIVTSQASESISVGMRLSVMCAEDVPFYPADTTAQAGESYLGDYVVRQFSQPCAFWPRGSVAPEFKEPLVSDVPTLLLSGENDPVTPPANAEAVAQGLQNSLHIVAPGQGHNIFYRGCLPTLIDEFIEQATVSGIDTACVQQLKPTPFFTSFTGPTP
jgi:pimeloyl-ACP methyl ester carboxylesterase